MLYIKSLSGFLVWIAMRGILVKSISLFDTDKIGIPELEKYTRMVYSLVSIIGLVIILDSINNFGMQFGYRYDDSAYFYMGRELADLIKVGSWQLYGLYETIVGLHILIIDLLSFGLFEVQLIHVISLNWMMTTLIVILSGYLSKLVTGYPINRNVLILSTLGCFTFFDSLTRLYRESLIILSILSAFIYVINKEYMKSMIGFLIAFVVRGANGFIGFLFLVLFRITSRVKSNISSTRIILILVFVAIMANVVIPVVTPFIVRNLTDITRTEKKNEYEQFDLKTLYEYRYEAYATKGWRGKAVSYAYNKGGFSGSIVLITRALFFPAQITPIIMSETYGSKDKSGYVTSKVFIYSFMRNIHTLLLSIYAPLFILGFVDMSRNNKNTKMLLFYYWIIVFAVTYGSMQGRHNLAFLCLNPIVLMSGYNYYISKKKWPLYLISISTIFFLGIYNVGNILR